MLWILSNNPLLSYLTVKNSSIQNAYISLNGQFELLLNQQTEKKSFPFT